MTVYFVTEKGTSSGPVKIGVTIELEKRLSSLQTGHHQELEVIASLEGGRETEAYLHESLAAHRIRGEWFTRSPEVEAAIERARTTGASALPLNDPGLPVRKTFSVSQDVEKAQALCRDLIGQVVPRESSENQTAWLARKLRRSCPSITARRVKTFLYAEARRIDHFEMMALIDLRDQLNRHCEDRSQIITIPIISNLMAEIGTPFNPDQQAITDRYLNECVERLRADRLDWGFDSHREVA